jgi:hypothetical protein
MKQAAVGVDRDWTNVQIVQPSLYLVSGHIVDSLRTVRCTLLVSAGRRVRGHGGPGSPPRPASQPVPRELPPSFRSTVFGAYQSDTRH